LKVYH